MNWMRRSIDTEQALSPILLMSDPALFGKLQYYPRGELVPHKHEDNPSVDYPLLTHGNLTR